ncbi:4-hydroxyproline epimerase [Bosea beijingensis]|uniref:4-hydroxyproline epimerase n=1 Tax=Bosea beijingensis TaxID=3068632 RepID=UPI0027409239|nr:4-hydroxyproline epimerase [Bosea sp. REN20]
MKRHSFFCIDAHTCGNPVRVVAGGAPILAGLDMAQRRQRFVSEHDWVRRALMFEPRGHDAMSGSILYPPSRSDCDLGILFIEVSGCLPMCGHGTIGTVTVAIEEGLVQPATPGRMKLEVPAGVVSVDFTQKDGYVDQVRLFNVASYLHAADVKLDIPGLGELVVDVAYGGNYYVIIEPQPNWSGLDGMRASEITKLSPIVRAAAQEAVAPVHPDNSLIAGVSHVMWTDGPKNARAHARNAVFYGDGGIDRSPCGTGSSARMAQRHAKGLMAVGDEFIHESLIGTMFDCRLESAALVGTSPAIMPSVAGWARITGHNTIFVDERDPLRHGFSLE